MAAIFFEPEQLAHEQLLLGTRGGRSASSGDAASGGDAGGGDAGAGAGVPVLPEFYRAKGLFEVAGSERMHALQAVQSTYELVEGPPWSEAQLHCQECPARRCCHAATHRQSATRERRAALWAREERPRRALGSGDRRGAGCRGGRAALVRSSTVADVRAPPVLTPRPGRAAPLVRDLHRAQPALARQPAQGAASVPGRRRHGCHVTYMSFKLF